MKKDVATFVSKCLICQQVKAEHQKPSGLLQPLRIPQWKWDDITMDFIVGLPKTARQHDTIWVIVDRLTKVSHFLPIRQNQSIEALAQLYVEEIVKLHGIPRTIVSDRDPRFTSKVWKQIQAELGTELKFSSAFHPQTDGQSERTIQTVEDMLRACSLSWKSQWDKHLPLVEFSYNNSYHASIRMAPFEALYGRPCRSPLHWQELGDSKLIESDLIQECTDKIKVIQENMKVAQQRQKQYADKRRKVLEFDDGDHVFLKVSPTKGVFRFGKRGKLKPRYIGPFQINSRVGRAAYQLALPPELAGVHDVFHVSLLRKYVHDPSHVIDHHPLKIHQDLSYEEEPIQVVDFKTKQLRNKVIPLVKVLWRHGSKEECTWESEQDMRAKYPDLFR